MTALDGPTSIYRYYDADGKLIYVGITGRGMVRQAQHNRSAEWWRFVSTQEVEHVDARVQALRREGELIRLHRPPFNRDQNPDWKRLRAAYLASHDGAPEGCSACDDRAEEGWCRGHDEGAVRARWALRWEVASAVLADKALHMVVDGEGGYLREPGFVSVGISALDEIKSAYRSDVEDFGVEALRGVLPGRQVQGVAP